MKLTVAAPAGTPAQVAMTVTPAEGATVVQGAGSDASLFTPSLEFQPVGEVPCTVRLTFSFFFRPWTLSVTAAAGAAQATADAASDALGLPAQTLISPDVMVVNLAFTEQPAGGDDA